MNVGWISEQTTKLIMPKKTEELPGVGGPGLSPLEIPEIEKTIAKYENKKEARCAETLGETEAKAALTAAAMRIEMTPTQRSLAKLRKEGWL